MEFRGDFGAEEEARLTPCKDDKPKYTEIMLFKAWLGYLLSPYVELHLHFQKIHKFVARNGFFVDKIAGNAIELLHIFLKN